MHLTLICSFLSRVETERHSSFFWRACGPLRGKGVSEDTSRSGRGLRPIGANLRKNIGKKEEKKQVTRRLVVQSKKPSRGTRRNTMPRNPGDTTAHQPLHAPPAPTDEQATDAVSRLPENAHQQAPALHAFERSRQIRSASDLLRGVLAYVYTVHSFEHLSIWSVLVGVADVSATDWRKRLQRASAWLTWLVQEVLAASSSVSPWLVRGGWRRILLIDGTHFTCPGPLGMVWRGHTGFDLLAGRLTQLKMTHRHEGEHLEVFELQAGDVVVTDRANGLRARIGFVHQQQADVVVRFTPHNLPLEDEQGRAIAVVSRAVWI